MPKLIVSNPVPDRSLVDLSRVKTELGITGTERDDLLRDWIRDDSDLVCEVCGVAPDQKGRRTFLSEAVTIVYDAAPGLRGIHRAPLFLPWRLPLDSETLTVSIDGTQVDESTYRFDAGAGLLERSGGGCWGGCSVTITASAGWAQADVPVALRTAVIRLVRLRWETKGRDLALKAKTVEGVGREEYWVGGTGPNGHLIPAYIMSSLIAANLVAQRYV
ncbi:hypothetical protein [Azospirillum tabaci]|uniref:hypothetical protein n=1 Tax=Azospirillum tabaci TaxID=2752310 RepID=UPI001660A676|nr:hypothetical protein [Azospirillum tabaci]